MTINVTVDMIAQAIHESDRPTLPWDKLPESERNPQRAAALRAARAVVHLFSPAHDDAVEAVENVRRILPQEVFDEVSETVVPTWEGDLYDATDNVLVTVKLSDEDSSFAIGRARARMLKPDLYGQSIIRKVTH